MTGAIWKEASFGLAGGVGRLASPEPNKPMEKARNGSAVIKRYSNRVFGPRRNTGNGVSGR